MTARHLESVASAVVERTLRRLPEPIREAAEQCSVEVTLMQHCLRAGEDLEQDLLGLFEGRTHADEASEMIPDIPRIRLFLDNLWDYAEHNRETFREEVRITLLHELGHFLGLDEAGVAALGLA
jgi:predicted Zn-dependent protease with MMP-like domain